MNAAGEHRIDSSGGSAPGTQTPLRTVSLAVAAALLIALSLVIRFAEPATAAVSPAYIGAFGPDGTEASNFESVRAIGVDEGTGTVYVADAFKQALFKFDEDGTPVDWGGSEAYISSNEISGLSLQAGDLLENQIAVDQVTHTIYVTSGNRVRAFEPDGEPHEFTSGPGAGTSEIPAGSRVPAVAVDANGAIYASDIPQGEVATIRIYSRSGSQLTEIVKPVTEDIANISPARLAVSPRGTLYIVGYNSRAYRIEPSQFPVTADTTYGVDTGFGVEAQTVNEQFSLSLAIDPTTEYVYIGEQTTNAFSASVYDDEDNLVGELELGHPDGGGGPYGMAVDGVAERLYVGDDFPQNSPTPGQIHQVRIFETFTPPVLKPSITSTSATALTNTTAILHGKVNPNTLETTYHFEYGTADCSDEPGACTSVPVAGASIGSGHKPVDVVADLSGLAPDTVYYYRIVATNSLDTTEGPVERIRTQSSAFGFEAMDGRVWEQVTPIDKRDGSIITSDAVPKQAAADGSALFFTTRGSIVGAPAGNRAAEPAAVLGRRAGGGSWSAFDLVQPQAESTGAKLPSEYDVFSPDLDRAVIEPRGSTPLSAEASERTPYLRFNTDPPSYRPLVTGKEGFANVPPGTVFGGGTEAVDENPLRVVGANEALTHIVVTSSKVPLVPGAEQRAIYVWSDGLLEPVSEQPANEGGGIISGWLGSGATSVRHAVSADGSRIFWSPEASNGISAPALYLRDTAADETVRLDVPQADASGASDGDPQEFGVAFMAASVDGSVVYFTDSQQLTANANLKGRDLYRCEVGDVGGSLGCSSLEDLSAGLGGEKIKVEELALGMSDDGSTVYFVENANLDDPRLYVWQKSQGVRFIASLSPGDESDWGDGHTMAGGVAQGALAVATSSPSGRYLAFMSERNLAGSETADPESGEPVEQAFVYDAVAETLACISCNPSGATDPGRPPRSGRWEPPLAGAMLPGAPELVNNGYSLYHPRVVLDNGRVFFNSPLPLVAADSNGTWDVYEYEHFGVGSCSAVARRPSIAVVDGACVGLVSAGTGDQPSTFMDASAAGDDVFFATTDRLSALDSDSIADIYDARVGGLAAEAERRPECLGEACQPPPSPPNDPTPASAAYSGPGDPKARATKHCRRGQGKVRRKGKVRCVNRRHHKYQATKGSHR